MRVVKKGETLELLIFYYEHYPSPSSPPVLVIDGEHHGPEDAAGWTLLEATVDDVICLVRGGYLALLATYAPHLVRATRDRLGLSQEELANLSRPGVTANTVARWERGEEMPSLEFIVALAALADDASAKVSIWPWGDEPGEEEEVT